MRVGIFGIVHNANPPGLPILCVSAHFALFTMPIPLAFQFYACRHIWHCSQCQSPWPPNSMCVGIFGIVDNANPPGLPILCVSAHLALFTMPIPLAFQFYVCRHMWHCSQCQSPWPSNSMRVGIFGIVHNANPPGLPILCVSAHLALSTMPIPLASQFYACRHIWHCAQCQSPWPPNSMRVGIFGIVHNVNPPGLPIICVSAYLALFTMPIPLASQFYACRHIWHCSQCQSPWPSNS